MDLKKREQKIQEKRKDTPFRDFVRDIGSHFPVNLYKYNGMISKYPETDRIDKIVPAKNRDNYPIIEQPYTGNFFADMGNLLKNSYLDNINFYGKNENCDYAEAVYGAKNGYLSFSFGDNAENVLYSCFVWTNVSNVIDSFYVEKDSSNIYNSYFVEKSFNIFFSKYITGSNNIWLSTNMIGCSECILCNDLQNQSYCIKDKQYTKEEYLIEKNKILSEKLNFISIYNNLPSAKNKNITNSTGVGLYQCNNVDSGYLVRNINDSKNVICGTGGYTGSSNIYDGLDVGLDSHNMYGTGMSGTNSDHLYCCSGVTRGSNLFYCYHMESCSYCLGCIGLKNKSFYILNKQYTKEERYQKANEIFEQMDKEGTLGQFLPGSINPFYFNDTAAYLIDDSFTREEVTKLGYLRRDDSIKVDIPDGLAVIHTNEIDTYEGMIDGKWTINAEILKKIIIDENGNFYRIIKIEYDFLMKYGLPVPRKHWLERMKDNFKI